MVLASFIVYAGNLILLKLANKTDLHYVHSHLPWIDAANSTVFFFATVLMTVKKLENCTFWIIGNIISIPIFLSQELYFTSFQYGVFLVLSILEFIEWKRKAELKNE